MILIRSLLLFLCNNIKNSYGYRYWLFKYYAVLKYLYIQISRLYEQRHVHYVQVRPITFKGCLIEERLRVWAITYMKNNKTKQENKDEDFTSIL